jgi:hypothetical protein
MALCTGEEWQGASFLQSSSIWFQSFILQGFGLWGGWLRSLLRPEFCRSRRLSFCLVAKATFSPAQINFSISNSLVISVSRWFAVGACACFHGDVHGRCLMKCARGSKKYSEELCFDS